MAGGGSSGPSSTKTETSNIPEYMQPYVEAMLGAAMQQVFFTKPKPVAASAPVKPQLPNQVSAGGDGDGPGFAQGGPVRKFASGGLSYDITGIKPYVPYSKDARDYVADFSPLQQQSFNAAANLSTPQTYGQALQGTADASAGIGALNPALASAGSDYATMRTSPSAMQEWMNPYVESSLQPQLALLQQQTGVNTAAKQAAATSSGAFGGTRSALQNMLSQQAGNMAMQNAIAQGYNTAFDQAQQAQQFGAQLGLQGQQAAQQGYAQQGALAQQQANIGAQQHASDITDLGVQNELGQQQQQHNQNIINQDIQNFANEQLWPYQQLTFLNSLIRGLPNNMTTSLYQAPPSTSSSLLGSGLSALGAYNAYSGSNYR